MDVLIRECADVRRNGQVVFDFASFDIVLVETA